MEIFEVGAANAMRDVADIVAKTRVRMQAEFEIDLSTIAIEDKTEVRRTFNESLSKLETAIYAVSLPDADPTEIHKALTAVRDVKPIERRYSRVHPLALEPTQTIYVGSSRDLRKRIMEHLGYGPKGTYSLHLLSWAAQFGRMKIDARFYETDTPDAVLVALEDYWASKLKPLFGRRGSV